MLQTQVFIRWTRLAFLAFAALLLPCGMATAGTLPQDSSSAVIFVYNQVGEDDAPRGGISQDLFKEHMRELVSGGYNIARLQDVIEHISSGKALPERTVVLTFDGAWNTSAKNAFDLLNEAQLPYTVFIATDLPDQSDPSHMSWRQIQTLAKNKNVTIGVMPASYAHVVMWSERERATVLNRAITRYREEFGEDPLFFAYTFGEFSTPFKKQLESYNFLAAFGQQSGVAYHGSDLLSLPRFSMTETFGDMERFKLTVNALPLPVTEVIPDNTLLTAAEADQAPKLGFTVTPLLTDLGKLSCFASGVGKLPLNRLGNNRIEIRFQAPLNNRKTRVNCTLPENTEDMTTQRWRWFGTQLLLPVAAWDDGTDSEENDSANAEETNTSALDPNADPSDIIQP